MTDAVSNARTLQRREAGQNSWSTTDIVSSSTTGQHTQASNQGKYVNFSKEDPLSLSNKIETVTIWTQTLSITTKCTTWRNNASYLKKFTTMYGAFYRIWIHLIFLSLQDCSQAGRQTKYEEAHIRKVSETTNKDYQIGNICISGNQIVLWSTTQQ